MTGAADPAPTHGGPAPMGWYEVGPTALRWWNGFRWTGMWMSDGVPRVTFGSRDAGVPAWVFALVAALFGLGYLVVADDLTSRVAGVGLLIVAVLAALVAVQVRMGLRQPAPRSAPVSAPILEPLPSVVEGPGSGWIATAPGSYRWWTGTRWAPYRTQGSAVLPTLHAERVLRRSMRFWLAIVLPGAVMLVLGFVGPLQGNSVAGLSGIVGTIFVLVGLNGILTMRIDRKALRIPAEPPADDAVRRSL